MPLHPRADDGIRTRDPHLGKVMRYQLRYIRTPRARSSPVAMQNISPGSRAYTNPLLARRADAQNRRSGRPGDHAAPEVGIGRIGTPAAADVARCAAPPGPFGSGTQPLAAARGGGVVRPIAGEGGRQDERGGIAFTRAFLGRSGLRASLLPRSTRRISGLVAQWESVRLTRGRSLVRNQPGPPPITSHRRLPPHHGAHSLPPRPRIRSAMRAVSAVPPARRTRPAHSELQVRAKLRFACGQ